jgi:hypothetical protein
MQNSTAHTTSIREYIHAYRPIHQVPKHLFAAKPAYLHEKYEDLDSFRQEIEESKAGLHHQPYTTNRRTVAYYKLIFFGFAVLFFGLGIGSLAIPTLSGHSLFISTGAVLKGVLVSLCTFLSLSSLAIALTLRAEREAVLQCVRKTRAQLATLFARKQMKLGIKRFFALFGPDRKKATAMRQMYHEAWDKVIDIKEETLHLVSRISTAETLDKIQKEKLLNQAVEEMNERLRTLVRSFKHAASPYFAE